LNGSWLEPSIACCSAVDAEGLDYAPYPGELGQRIYENVSKEAWQRWLKHQTMLLNEYRLTPIDPKARKFLVEEMEKFLFGGGLAKTEGIRRAEREIGM
jgi:Fe-S cluster biosynthesis and repair protein YggX